jgi:hypothetical protein
MQNYTTDYFFQYMLPIETVLVGFTFVERGIVVSTNICRLQIGHCFILILQGEPCVNVAMYKKKSRRLAIFESRIRKGEKELDNNFCSYCKANKSYVICNL